MRIETTPWDEAKLIPLNPSPNKKEATRSVGRMSSCAERGLIHLGQHVTQRGAALLVALILLVVITLVGLAAMSATILQNKAAANQYDRQIAFQSAEAAIRQAEISITNNTNASNPAPAGVVEDCSTPDGATSPQNTCGLNPFNESANPNVVKTNVTTSQFDAGALAAGQPQYSIQFFGRFAAPPGAAQQTGGASSTSVLSGEQRPRSARYYRITARSGNPALVSERSIVTLQSTFRAGE